MPQISFLQYLLADYFIYYLVNHQGFSRITLFCIFTPILTFHFMPDQSESPSPKAAVSSTASKSKKGGTGKSMQGVKFGNLKFKLPYDMERALRFASFQLEVNPKATFIEPEELVIEAVRRHLDLLAKHVTFSPGMWPVSKADSEPTT